MTPAASPLAPVIAQAEAAYRAGGLAALPPEARAALSSDEWRAQLLLALAAEVASQSRTLHRLYRLTLIVGGILAGALGVEGLPQLLEALRQ